MSQCLFYRYYSALPDICQETRQCVFCSGGARLPAKRRRAGQGHEDAQHGKARTGLPGTPEALPLGELAAKQTERAIKGYTSSRKSLGVSFFEENATVPTHRRCTLLSVKC